MDWKLTKNYIILFLTILNIILFGLIFFSKKDFELNNSQQKSIIKYAKQNNIEINTKLPKKFYPMSSISMKKINHNKEILTEIFLGSTENIKKTTKFDTKILEKDNKILFINNDVILFKDFNKIKNFSFEENNIIKIANNIKKSLEKYYGKMNLDYITKIENYYNINFVQNIKGYKNFSNFLNIKIYQDGQKLISFNYFEEIEKLNELKNICSPDEALYTFIQEIITFLPINNLKINKIDLGYYLGNTNENYEYIFKPYYRIYLENFDIPFYINAYTNNFELDLSF